MDQRYTESDTTLFDKIPATLFRIRVIDSKFIFTDANAAGYMLTGGKISELLGRDIFNIWSKPSDRHIADNIAKAYQSGECIEETCWHDFVSDKVRRYIKLYYVPYGVDEVLLSVDDFTNERLKSEKLTHMESRYRALFERGDTGLLEGLPEKFYECNAQIARLFGYSIQEFMGLKLNQLVPEHELPGLQNLLQKSQNAPHKLFNWEGLALHRSGDTFWVHAMITGIDGKDGEFGHYLASVTDITEQKEAARALQRALIETVKAVSATIEIHDAYTAGHMDRVAEICTLIGRELGMTDDELLGLNLGASVYDIGKIGIPSSILSKPIHLSAVEFELVKDHTKLGLEVIKGIEFPWPVKEMVAQHHERLDGSGYPEGLKGKAIAKEARLLAVVDVFVAVTSHRPYRPAAGIEEATAILENDKENGKLDPVYVDCLLDLIKRGEITTT